MRLFSFLFFILSFSGASAQGNSDSLISIRLERAGLADVFTVVEQQTGFHFYYDKAQIDSPLVSIRAEKENINSFLQRLLDTSGLYFAIDRNRNVFISRVIRIQPELPVGYYPEKTPVRPAATAPVLANVKNRSEKSGVGQ